MKNVKMFFMRHVGLTLTMMAGYAGMNASSESDFKKCMETKKALIDMCSTYKLDSKFIQHYTTINNSVFKNALERCVYARSGHVLNYHFECDKAKYEREFVTEVLADLDNIKKAASQVRCDQLRKDFITGLASVQSEENKAAVIKAFEGSLTDCK